LVANLPEEGPVIVLIGAVLRKCAAAPLDFSGYDLAALGSCGCRAKRSGEPFSPDALIIEQLRSFQVFDEIAFHVPEMEGRKAIA
jgi:hypothetical protein